MSAYRAHNLAQCGQCGLVYADREPTQAELDELYSNYPTWTELASVTRDRYHELLEAFEAFRRTGRLIDVGSGSGFFLDVAVEHGWEAHGTEYDPVMVARCALRGLHMQQGPLATSNYPVASFDVLTCFEVLEHLVFPQEELERFAELIRPGGLLYLTTPNFNSISRRLVKQRWSVLNYPEHLNYFTPRSLRQALKRAGFQDIRIRTTGVSIMRLRNSVTTVQQDNTDPQNDDQRLRVRIEGNTYLRAAKSLANQVLTQFGAGDTLKIWARRA